MSHCVGFEEESDPGGDFIVLFDHHLGEVVWAVELLVGVFVFELHVDLDVVVGENHL